MAPEVVRGDNYDGRCDWWSVGVIFYECLYGHTPFLAEEGRSQTKRNIMDHEAVFKFPTWPAVSRKCQNLLRSLIAEKSQRLCSSRYRLKDAATADLEANRGHLRHSETQSLTAKKQLARQYVFPYDAEDIKTHKFFRGVPWEHLHLMPPPFVPDLRSKDDTRYFDSEEAFSDSNESSASSFHGGQMDGVQGDLRAGRPSDDNDCIVEILEKFDLPVQERAFDWISKPYDSSRLKTIHAEINHMIAGGLPPAGGEVLRQFVKQFGTKDKKRPRDRLLRDRMTKQISMEVRKRSAFLGYTWRRMPQPPSRLGATKA